MTPLAPNELDRRIFALLDGTIAADEHHELEQHLLASEEARGRYVELAALHSLLELDAEQAGHGVLQRPVPVELVLARQRRRLVRFAAFSAAAILIATAFVLRLVFLPPAATATLAKSEGTVLSVTHSSSLSKPPPDGALAPGSTLNIIQGTIELTFESGVRAIVQAPETLTVIDHRSVAMRRGTAWFQVPANAAGFEVRTPEMRVIDLGTEFGVIARPDAADEVHVFKGKVRVEANHGAMEGTNLAANEARATFVNGRISGIPPAPERFLTKLPAGLTYLHWSFDETDPAAITAVGRHPLAARITASPQALIHGSALRAVRGKTGRALATDGSGAYLKTTWQGIGGNAPRSMAYWIRLQPDAQYLDPVVGWGDRSGLRAFYSSMVNRDYGERTVAAVSFEEVWYEGTTYLDDGQWHHICHVYTGNRLPDGGPEVFGYVDGKPDELRRRISPDRASGGIYPVETDATSRDAFPLTVFCHLYGAPDGIRQPMEIDELFVVCGAITPEQVANLMRANRPDPKISGEK